MTPWFREGLSCTSREETGHYCTIHTYIHLLGLPNAPYWNAFLFIIEYFHFTSKQVHMGLSHELYLDLSHDAITQSNI